MSATAVGQEARSRDVRGYNAGAMVLHWAIAICILFQLAVGFSMSRLDAVPEALRFALFQWHKTIGLMVLTLTIARIVWRLLNPPPAHVGASRLEAAAAGLVHILLYGLMIVVPLTGWLLVSASPTRIPTLLFLSETLPWPSLPLPDAMRTADGEALAATSHLLAAYLMAGLVVLHVAGALKHSLLDRTPSLSRILPARRLARQSTTLVAIPVALALAVSFLAGGLSIGRSEVAAPQAARGAAEPGTVAVGAWSIDPAASTLRYDVAFSGKPIGGTIARWTADVVFDPADLDAASARVVLDAASIGIEDAYVRGNLAGADGLDIAKHPEITVTFDRFAPKGDGFEACGRVELKGRSAPITLAFTFERRPDGSAHVLGEAVLRRLDLGLGAASDPAGAYLGKALTVKLDLSARPPEAAANDS